MFENAVVMPVRALPSIAGKAPVSAVAFSVPFTPSISNVESSAYTEPVISPVTFNPVTVEPVKSTEPPLTKSTAPYIVVATPLVLSSVMCVLSAPVVLLDRYIVSSA